MNITPIYIKGYLKTAAVAARKIRKQFPDNIRGYLKTATALNKRDVLKTATALNKLGKGEEAFELLQDAIEFEARKVSEKPSERSKRLAQIFLLMATTSKEQGKYHQAAEYFIKSINCYPLLMAFKKYAVLIQLLEKNNVDVIVRFMESFLSTFPNNTLPNRIYGDYCYNINCDVEKAKSIYLDGLKKDPTNEKLLISILKIALFNQDHKEINILKKKLTDLGTYNPKALQSFYPDNYIDNSELNENCRSLDEFITRNQAVRPKIIDAEFHSFAKEKSENEPCIALLAYTYPRPNLDVIYHLYQLLKSRGRNVILFLLSNDLDKFDFSEIDIKANDVFYSAWREFFYAADFIKCIISSDLCHISHNRLPKDCKLVFHAPHGSKVSSSHRNNFKSHYSTFLNTRKPPDITSDLQVSLTLDKCCLIPNSYTKNEYLFDFVAHFKCTIKAISYCPTIFTGLYLKINQSADRESTMKEYLGQIVGMVREVMKLYPDYYFIYRPMWAHPEHWTVTRRLLDEFGNNRRFLIDEHKNSKYALVMSRVMITDYSGLAITFSDMKQMRHIRFQPYQLAAIDEDVKGDDFVICQTYGDVGRSISDILEKSPDRGPTNLRDLPLELRNLYGGLTYLANNIDYILEDKKNPDWFYYDFS